MDKENFLEALEELLELDADSIKGDEALTSLDTWDSLAILGFISFADEKCGKILSVTDINQAQTVNDLYALIS